MAVVYNNLKAAFVKGNLSVNILFGTNHKISFVIQRFYRSIKLLNHSKYWYCYMYKSMKYRKNILMKVCNNQLASKNCSRK